jgi:mono/diheme cytochrome c family protein
MTKSKSVRLACGLFLAMLVWVAQTELAQGQFTQNRDTIKVDASRFPPDVQKDYRVFRNKCSECHGVDTSLKLTLSPAGWSSEVKRMQAMPSSQFNDKQAATITAFLGYYGTQHNLQSNLAVAANSSSAIAAGRKFYFAQNCDACHKIAGQGGEVGPELTNVASRLSPEKLSQAIQSIRTGKDTSMPQLPPNTTNEQINDLVDFLMTLKGGK